MKRLAITLSTALVALGCGGSDLVVASPGHDTPIAADEARAEVKIRIDLAPEQGCEEAFDLAMYKDRGIDLVQWDAKTGDCAGRTVTIRYLSQKLDAKAVIEAARAHAVKAEAIAEK